MGLDPELIGFILIMATLMATAFGVKLLFVGRGPIRRLRPSTDDPRTNERFAELEERVEKLSELVVDQSQVLGDYHERLDFTERLLTKKQEEAPKAVESPTRERS